MPMYKVEVTGWALLDVEADTPADAERQAKRYILGLAGVVAVDRFHPDASTVHAIPHDDDGPFCKGCDKPFAGKGDVCPGCLYRRADHLRDLQRNARAGL